MQTDLDKSRDKAIRMLNLNKLQVACSEGDVGTVAALLEGPLASKASDKVFREASDSPCKEDVYLGAHLPIHTACQRRHASKDVIHTLLKHGNYLISDKTVNGDTALHVACNSSNVEAVEALLNLSGSAKIRDCLKHQNKDGDTPFHLTSRSGSPTILKLLLEQLMPTDYKQVISKTNRLGETSVGLAVTCQDKKLISLYFKYTQCNPATLYSDLIKIFPECDLVKSLQAFDHQPNEVFILGDTKSGKSSLISTIQYTTLNTLSKVVSALSRTSAPESQTGAGILPTTVEFRKPGHRCSVTFYDVTGHRSYTQEAVFKHSKNPLEALYVITVDLRKDFKESILYWLNFLYHQLVGHQSHVLQSGSKMKLKIAIAGTYCDTFRSPTAKKVDYASLIHSHEDLASHFIWCGDFNLNARKPGSLHMPQFLATLHDQCNSVSQEQTEALNPLEPDPSLQPDETCRDSVISANNAVSPICSTTPEPDESKKLLAETYLLATVLLKEYPNSAVATFSDVIGLVQRSNHTLCQILPKADEEIERLCHNLRYLGSFKLFIFDTSKGKLSHSYIVFDYKYLLESVNKALQSLSHVANGIVTRQQIKSTFYYRPDFIIRFLEHCNLCEYISRKGLESMKMSVRSSRRSLTSISSSRSGLNTVISPNRSTFDLPSIKVDMSPQKSGRTHRRTQSLSNTLDEITDERRLSESTPVAVSNLAISTPESPRQLGIFFGSKPSSNNSSPGSSRRSSRKSNSSYQQAEPHYFFPSLIPTDPPGKLLWEEENSDYMYGFAWSLVPHEGDSWFLSPKFITITLFRLLFSFAPRLPNQKPTSMDRLCTLWKRGIVWSDPVGARVCVAIADDNKITLSMQCMCNYEVACLSVRNEIMADIKQQLKEIHPGINPREIFTPFDGVSIFPVIDPFNSYASFDKNEIHLAIVENRLATCTQGKHLKPIDVLLHFEPLSYLTPHLLEELISEQNSSKQISDDFCMQLAMKLSTKWTYLASHFTDTVIRKYFIDSLLEDASTKRAPHDMAMEMLMRLKVVDYGEECKRADTYGGLCKTLFEISIFSPHEFKK